uniref:THUMP domain-containing protein n=2 Tax=Biomphalaria glabrata TaxID=6526 RepID=A0A2C9K269_BIOGL
MILNPLKSLLKFNSIVSICVSEKAMFGHQSFGQQSPHGGWDLYGGPQEYIEPGYRGFLITTLPGKEEFAVDDTITLLRQASIKIYGAVQIQSKKLALNPRYLAIDFMDPANIKLWPTPEEERDREEEEEEAREKEREEREKEKEKEKEKKDKEKGNKEDKEKNDKEEKEALEETSDKTSEIKENENKTEEEETKKEESQLESAADNNAIDNKEEEEKESEKQSDRKESDQDRSKDHKSDQAKKEASKDKSASSVPKKKQFPIMRSIYKFKAYRTETRNVMFIKSDVPDPLALAEAAMELLLERRRVYEDGACQLLPVIGVCNFDLEQLEVMSKRVLSSMFTASVEPKNFSVMVLENLGGPSTENVLEVVRNTIWALNPSAWQTSPLTEPDIFIQIDLVGSKLIMCCVTKYMHYRYYSPNLLVKQGRGEPEDDDGTWLTAAERKQQEEQRLARERQIEFERQRQEDLKKERERRRAFLEERRKAKMKATVEGKSRKNSGSTSDKQEGSKKKAADAVSEDGKEDLPPSKNQS